MSYAVYGHCASGWTELEDVKPTLASAKKYGESVLKRAPVTPCGTGGVKWVEVIGTDVPEPELPRTPDGEVVKYEDDPTAWAPYFAWENTNVMIGLGQGETEWTEA